MEFTIQNIAVGEELHSVNVFFGTKALKQKASTLEEMFVIVTYFLFYIYIYFNLNLNEFCLKLRTGMAQLF